MSKQNGSQGRRRNNSGKRGRRNYILATVERWYGWQQEQKFVTKEELLRTAKHISNKNIFSSDVLLRELRRVHGSINTRYAVEVLEELIENGELNLAPGKHQYRILR